MTKKAQTIFTVCFVAFLISVVSLSFVFADSIPHNTETPQITGGYLFSFDVRCVDEDNLENQIAQLNEDMTIFMDRAASTGGDVDKYEAELKKMFEQLTALRNLLETAKSQAAQSETVNNEVARLTECSRI